MEPGRFACPACGASELAEIRQTPLVDAIEGIPNGLQRKVSLDKSVKSISAERLAKVTKAVPAYACMQKWSDFSLFDLIMVIGNFPGIVWDLPLEFLKPSAWIEIWPHCHGEDFAFAKRFLATQDASWLQQGFQDTGLSTDCLRRLSENMAAMTWSNAESEGLRGFATFVAENVTSCPEWAKAVAEFQIDVQLIILSKNPECPGLSIESLLPNLPTSEVVRLLSYSNVREIILSTYQFEKFGPGDWRIVLTAVKQDPTSRLKAALKQAWPSIEFSDLELYTILTENPEALHLLPVEDFTPERFAYLLPIVDDGGELAKQCPYDRFTRQIWLDLLLKPQAWKRSGIVKAVMAYNAKNILKEEDLGRVVTENPCAVSIWGMDAIPLEVAVKTYIEHPEFCTIDDDTVFLRCSAEQIALLLANATHIPTCTTKLLKIDRQSRLSSETIKSLLNRNPALGRYLPKERIAELDAKTFFEFARRFEGADFWMSAFDLSRLTQPQRLELVKEFPWLAHRINIDE